jgi:hypothetical protein
VAGFPANSLDVQLAERFSIDIRRMSGVAVIEEQRFSHI